MINIDIFEPYQASLIFLDAISLMNVCMDDDELDCVDRPSRFDTMSNK